MHKFLEKLEYTSILNILSSFCNTYLGKNMASNLEPCFDYSKVSSMLQETLDATNLIYKIGKPSISPIPNVDMNLKLLSSSGILSIKDLLDLTSILKVSRELIEYYKTREDFESVYLTPIFNNLYSNIGIENTIFSNLTNDLTVEDSASVTLASIRKKRRNLEQQIKEKLKSFISSSSYSKYIQESVITIRNNRYVIPVKEEFRSFVKGLVHDVSSTGSTVFIEPISIFEMNNDIASLGIEEANEIEKILIGYSNLFVPILQELQNSISAIGKLDFIFAKANYGLSIHSNMPILSEEKYLNLIQARHPLIPNDVVVPIDLYLGNDFNTLVITGPNTGGKTVSLKTTGLLCLMAYSGLLIPAHEKSVICVFDCIFSDIGDEQSIVESLSTFSSHMITIIEIIKLATKNSLILLDELGSGTDPIEGANLAISILEYFSNLGCLTISTTHYSEIKNHALTHSNFKNASCEFDIELLKPTYRLLMGIPGKSNAFAISKRLGLNDSILAHAKSLVNEDSANIEELLKNIYDNKLQIEKEKHLLEENLEQVEILKASLQKDNFAIEEQTNELIQNAKLEARRILEGAKREASMAISKINQSGSSEKDLNQIRNSLNTSIKNNSAIITSSHTSSLLNIKDINIGDTVFLLNLNQTGIITDIKEKNKQIQVQVGSVKTYVPISSAKLVSSNKCNHSNISHTSTKIQSKPISSEINVIGMNVEEAIFVIDKYLDDCIISNIQNIRIVHGKGTGTLRNGIHNFLKKHSHVNSFRLGTFGEGETGVTVVELKK